MRTYRPRRRSYARRRYSRPAGPRRSFRGRRRSNYRSFRRRFSVRGWRK